MKWLKRIFSSDDLSVDPAKKESKVSPISKQSEVNATGNSGDTPLFDAIFLMEKDAIKSLVERGADVNAKLDNGETPLHLAVTASAIHKAGNEIIELFIAKGADVNAMDHLGATPIHYACANCELSQVEFLIASGADVNAETKKKATPLQVAYNSRDNKSTKKTGEEYEELFRLLMMNGAVLDTSDKIALATAELLKQRTSSEANFIGSPDEFTDAALAGSARWRLPIKNIPSAVTALTKKLQESGVPSNALHDLVNNGLLSVCPVCNEYCAGKALLSMEWMTGTNTLFTGKSGGFERMLEGRCLNYACNSTEHELYWCPDLNPKYLAELQSRGIRIDPNIQSTRERVWKPKQ